MPLKLSLSYLAGAVTVAGAVYLEQGRTTLVVFGLGFLSPVLILTGVLCSGRRLRRIANTLNKLAQVFSDTGTAQDAPASPLQADLVSALVNLRTPRKKATAAAQSAIQTLPAGASFEQLFTAALRFVQSPGKQAVA